MKSVLQMVRWRSFRIGAFVLLALYIIRQLTMANIVPSTTGISIKSESRPYRLHQRPKKTGSNSPSKDQAAKSFSTVTPISINVSFSSDSLQVMKSKAINSTLITSIVDKDFIDFALNFYHLSIMKHGFHHYVPICLDEESFNSLHHIPCVGINSSASFSQGISDFGSQSYHQKTNMKTIVMYELLRLNFTVLMSDVDVIFFKNPFPFFTCSECDVHIQMDRALLNSGFVYARPTRGSLALYEQAWDYYLFYHKASDQSYINMAARDVAVKIHQLSRKLFVCGTYYFQQSGRSFMNTPYCDECVIAHNNYIGSVAAKKYRFRENHMWVIDHQQYYTHRQRRYMTYTNRIFDDHSKQTEEDSKALKIMLYISFMLNRTLVLPYFRCCDCNVKKCDNAKHKCSLLSVLRLKKFDKQFSEQYREHSFLQNRLVPDEVTKSISPFIDMNITSKFVTYDSTRRPNSARARLTLGLTEAAIIEHLSPYKSYAVINTSAIYGPVQFENENLLKRIDNAIECSAYEQWDPRLDHL